MRVLADGRGLAKVSKTTVAIVNGTEDLSEWTEEELQRGARRGSDGRFRKPPVLIAKAVHDELVRRRLAKAYDLIRESTADAVRLLRSIVNDPEAADGDRIKAAELILDRAMGKPRESVSLDVGIQAPWQRVIVDAIVGTEAQARELSAGEVVEGEVVEEDPLDDLEPLDS
jgi:hypothetical protein